MKTTPIPIAELKNRLAYDSVAGIFTWRNPTNRAIKPGDMAGTLRKNGYLQIRLMGKTYLAHRLAWAYVNGKSPSNQIDHINGNSLDNSIKNLRDVEPCVNAQNKRKAGKSTFSKLLGVVKSNSKWGAKINVGGKTIWLGVFDRPDVAHSAYVSAKRIHHAGCTL